MKKTLSYFLSFSLIFALCFTIYPSAIGENKIVYESGIDTQDTLLSYVDTAKHHYYKENGSFIKVKIDEIFDQNYFTTSDFKDGFLKARCIVIDDPFGQYLVDDSFTVSFRFSLLQRYSDSFYTWIESKDIKEFLMRYDYFYICTTPELNQNGSNYLYDSNGRKFKDYDFTNIATIELSDYFFIPVKDGVLDFQGLCDWLSDCGYKNADWNYIASDMEDFIANKTEAEAIEKMRDLYENYKSSSNNSCTEHS